MGSPFQAENHAVEAYLQWITNKVPPVAIDQDRIDSLDAQIKAEPRLFKKAQLIARRHEAADPTFDEDALVERFVKYAPSFSERNSISYAVWREMGVPADVLKQAGLKGEAGEPKPKRKTPGKVKGTGKFNPEFLAEFKAYYDEHGLEVTATHYGYEERFVKQMMTKITKGTYAKWFIDAEAS